jgi:hypothetical protein
LIKTFVGNLGEWSEPYALLKIISDGFLQEGDKNYEALDTQHEVKSLTKPQRNGDLTIELTNEFAVVRYDGCSRTVPRERFSKFSNFLFENLVRCKKEGSTNKIEVPEVNSFLPQILVDSLTTHSSSNADIHLKIIDHRTSKEQDRGFSVKSQLGSPSHLMNHSGRNTCFGFELKGLTQIHLEHFKNKKWGRSKVVEKVQYLDDLKRRGEIQIIPKSHPEGDLFFRNLILVDDGMPTILSAFLWESYLNAETEVQKVIPHIIKADPNNYGSNFSSETLFYERKIKRFLVACSMGLTGAKAWSGQYQSDGGYIIVLRSGNIISYHIYDRQNFEDYLFYNTRQDTPASSKKKGNFGDIYLNQGRYEFFLNLSLRFTK